MIIFFIAQYAVGHFLGTNKNTNTAGPGADSPIPAYDARPDGAVGAASYSAVPQMIAPIWPMNSTLDFSIYVSPSLAMPALSKVDPETLVLEEKAFALGNFNEKREIDTSFAVPTEAQNGGNIWAHFYVALQGYQMDPAASDYDVAKAYHFYRPLNQMLAKKKIKKTKKLLGGSDASDQGDVDEVPKGPTLASYYHPNFTMSFIPDAGTQSFPQMHVALRQYVVLEATGARDASGQNGWYYPILFVNTFWQLRSHMTELNSTVTRLPLHITLNNMQNWKYSIFASIDDGMKRTQQQIANGGPVPAAGDGSEFEEFKKILLDTNIYLLSTTAVVSVLHMIFEMLAFKSDIVSHCRVLVQYTTNHIFQSHWRHKKDNVGISVRTILANVFMQTIIFLYLLDNNENTSWMIMFGQGMGILLEAWKITKTVDVRIRPAPQGSWLPYHVTFEDKHKLSETEQKTKEYDEIAFRYLYLVAIPLLGAYAVYSVLYDTHKSWYSFVITTLVGSVYAYGFLMMVPSLYINYRLKVASPLPHPIMIVLTGLTHLRA